VFQEGHFGFGHVRTPEDPLSSPPTVRTAQETRELYDKNIIDGPAQGNKAKSTAAIKGRLCDRRHHEIGSDKDDQNGWKWEKRHEKGTRQIRHFSPQNNCRAGSECVKEPRGLKIGQQKQQKRQKKIIVGLKKATETSMQLS
jgi:hypothetical protein